MEPFEPRIDEDYEQLHRLSPAAWRPVGLAVREAVIRVFQDIGVGNPDTVCRNLVLAELRHCGHCCEAHVEVTPTFHEQSLPTSPITPILVEQCFCLQVEAIQDEISARAIRTLQTHLRLTSCESGIVTSFGKSKLSLRGVHA